MYFIYYVNSCSFFADFSIKSFSQKIFYSITLACGSQCVYCVVGGNCLECRDGYTFSGISCISKCCVIF